MIVKDEFKHYEADAWFNRNKDYIDSYVAANDEVIRLIADYKLAPGGRYLEIGCSAGYRLNGIRQMLPDAEVHGVELSQEAIAYGNSKYPGLHLHHLSAEELSVFEDGSFDVVVIGFVLYILDRELLFRLVYEIDRILKNGGALIIMDFLSIRAKKNGYAHIKALEAYAYKQPYERMFAASEMYHIICQQVMNHDDQKSKIFDSRYNEKVKLTLLKKDVYAAFDF